MSVQVSVVMPAYNEAENLPEVVPEVLDSLRSLACAHEVVVVDDGSTDGTHEVMTTLAATHPEVRYVRLRRNQGKSAALAAGFDVATGDTVVLMDADGQDDPAGIGSLLDALDAGLDQVTGSRTAGRNDRFVKRHTSRIYNRTTAWISGVDGKDFNSGFKAMRREVVDSLVLRGELHRYIPVLAHWAGFRVGEVETTHRPRLHGTTKFGINRFWRGMFDLLTVKFLTTYTARPFHLFGGSGIVLGLVGSVLLAWMGIEKLAGNSVGTRPALLTGVLLTLAGLQLLSVGLVAELVLHYRRPDAPDYAEP